MPTNNLQHFGVRGMRWGVRKDQKGSGRASAKTEKKFEIPEKKSSHRIALEAKGLKKGLSGAEAEQFAAKTINGQKIALGILAAGAVGVGAYAAYRGYGKYFTDINIAAGGDFHYINSLGDKATFDRRLYTTFQKGDVQKYQGMFAEQHLRGRQRAQTVYDTVLSAKEEIKAPSHYKAKKLYAEMASKYPKNTMPSYKDMNIGVVGDEYTGKKFMAFLKERGYNAMLDYNDQFVSGYDAKQPLIVFNASSSLVKKGQTVVDQTVSKPLYNQEVVKLSTKMLAPYIGIGAAAIGTGSSVRTASKGRAVDKFMARGQYKGYSKPQLFNAVVKNPVTGAYVVDPSKLSTN